jgi:hypothetical protein
MQARLGVAVDDRDRRKRPLGMPWPSAGVPEQLLVFRPLVIRDRAAVFACIFRLVGNDCSNNIHFASRYGGSIGVPPDVRQEPLPRRVSGVPWER